MVSIDVKLLFTNGHLDRAIDDILQRIIDDEEIQTTMTKKELKELLILVQKMLILLLVVRLLFNLMVWLCVHHWLIFLW